MQSVVPALAMDIVGEVNRFLALLLLGIAFYLAFLYRDRVVTLMTGDDRVHCDLNSSIWQVLTCCRFCEGEWTRALTSSCCWPFRSSKGKNLLHLLGQRLGLTQIPIEVTNIIVGDLPAVRSGDFYLTVETSSNPPQITAVVDNCDPKVVNFPDSLIIKVRRSTLDSNVRFVVKKMHTVGSVEICECYISPKMLLYWMEHEQGPVRIRMEPCRRDYNFTLPAWILIDLQEHLAPSRGVSQFDLTVRDAKTGDSVDYDDANKFKKSYELLHVTGFRSQEPDETMVGSIDTAYRRKAMCLGQLFMLLLLGSGTFMVSRLYCMACFQKYSEITVLNNFGVLFPVFDHDKTFYRERCNLNSNLFVGMFEDDVLFGQALSNEKVDPNCTVTREQVMHTCDDLPIGARHPNLRIGLGFFDVYIPCLQQTCPIDEVLRHWGSRHVMFVVIMFLLILCTWGACNWHILNLQDHVLTESRGMAYTHVQQSPGLLSP